MPFPRIIRWQPWTGRGIEHALVDRLPDGGFIVSSILAADHDGAAIGLSYLLQFDPDWSCRTVGIASVSIEPIQVSLTRPGASWRDGAGIERGDLRACADVDIRLTPLTNTPAILRLRLARGDAREIDAIYLAPPSWQPRLVRQRYTCLEPGRLYRYEDMKSGFAADLPLDEDGFVLDYPGFFRRID